MKTSSHFLSPLAALTALATFSPWAPGHAESFAPASPFTDHMVLQREKPVTLWGSATPGTRIEARFANQTKDTQTDASGTWRITLDPMAASHEGRDLILEQKGSSSLTLHDVVVGEVWLASGQSNMGMGLASVLNSREEIAAAKDPRLRFYQVPQKGSLEPLSHTAAEWQAISPANALRVSGVAYFFARELAQKLEVPIGVLISAVGATDAESWTPTEALTKDPEWNATLQEQRAQTIQNDKTEKTFVEDLRQWRAINRCEELSPVSTDWAQPDLNTSDWQRASGRFAPCKALKMDSGGVIWLRKEITVSEAKAGKPALLWIDALNRQLLTFYVNGKEVGSLGLSGPRYYQAGLLTVPVPAGAFQSGKNVVAVRCTIFEADSFKGFTAPKMRFPTEPTDILDDAWHLKAETVFPTLSADALATLPKFTNADAIHTPAGLYNGMIHPLIPYSLRGAIWYQGESNIRSAHRYRELLTALIGEWRARWGAPTLPFYLVQLANMHQAFPNPASTVTPNLDDSIGRLREAQLQVSQSVPNTALAVTIDTGEASIHPVNKQDVGNRLARIALGRTYGRTDIEHLSPLFESVRREKSALRVTFKDCPGGLMVAEKKGLEPATETPDAPLRQFAIAGEDRKFVWAEARIEGNSVLVSSPTVPEPVAVRYAWAENPEGRNLYGKNGLPASPFRTDDFPAPKR